MKTRITISTIIAIVFSMLWSFVYAQSSAAVNEDLIQGKKVLIIYLSRTNNTKAIAGIIHNNVGGTLTALELKTPYPTDYKKTVDQVAKENDTGFLPPLQTKIDNIKKYDIIFIGFPTWGMQLPPPIKSFLTQYNLKDKIVIPFNTNAGYGIGSSFATLKALAPASKVLEGFSIQGGKERDGIYFIMQGKKEEQAQAAITNWLKNINILK
jgi:flavodoxin